MGSIIQKNIVDSFKADYAAYKLAVNRKRAMPNARDGFKEVHRRITDVMVNDKPICMSKFIKSQTIVGETMGKSHPHGDSSIYGAMASFTQWFSCYMPLFESESNFGSFVGDGPASPRYTEIKMTKFCKEYIVGDIIGSGGDKNIVDWKPTYSGLDVEPEFFAAKIPILLINGSTGIGVGKATDIPAHNINEVIDATLTLIDNPNADIVIIPDQIMPCDIDKSDWKSIAHTGNGGFKVRGRVIIDDYKGSKDPDTKKITFDKRYKDHKVVIIKSLPDQVRLDTVNEALEDLVIKGELPQVIDIIADSDEKDPNHMLVVKKGADPEYVRNIVYTKTPVTTKQKVNFNVIIKETEEPVRLSQKAYLEFWIMFAMDSKRRLYYNRLRKVKTDIHEKDAFIKAIESDYIDEIVTKIRKRTEINDKEFVEWLIKILNITDLQAEYIINARLKYLSKGYLVKLKEEASELRNKEDLYTRFITDDNLIKQEIKDDLIRCKNEYGFKRHCKVVDISNEEIPDVNFKIILSDNNYIKKIDVNEPVGNVNGKVKHVLSSVNNRESLLLFNTQGRVFKLPINNIPLSTKKDQGFDLRLLVKKNMSPIIKVIYEPLIADLAKRKIQHFMIVLSKNNLIKKVSLDDFLAVTPSGLIYTKLKDDDEVQDIQISADTLDIVIYNDKKALRCSMVDIPEYKKNTVGVNAMYNTDTVDGMTLLTNNTTDIIVLTELGKINRIDASALPRSERYKSGNSVIKITGNDKIKYIFGANSTDTVHVERANGEPMDLPVANLKYGSSISAGEKVIPLKADMITKAKIVR